MKVLVLISVAVCCVLSSPLQEDNESKRSQTYYQSANTGRNCVTREGILVHGQHVRIRQNPCMEYKCEDANLRILKSGCPNDRKCYSIGATWHARDCHTYTCRATGQNSVEIKRTQSGCLDAYKQCRRPGERFPYEQSGRISWGCTCRSTPDFISYDCPPQ